MHLVEISGVFVTQLRNSQVELTRTFNHVRGCEVSSFSPLLGSVISVARKACWTDMAAMAT